jgi:hypothetical protein
MQIRRRGWVTRPGDGFSCSCIRMTSGRTIGVTSTRASSSFEVQRRSPTGLSPYFGICTGISGTWSSRAALATAEQPNANHHTCRRRQAIRRLLNEGPAPPRLSGLDLLRAIAICWVMLYHASLFGLASQDYWVIRLGWMGVDRFFVLSGFLIAGQLLRPWARGLRPDYPRFISRRLLRTLPAYLAVVALYFIFPALRDRVRRRFRTRGRCAWKTARRRDHTRVHVVARRRFGAV